MLILFKAAENETSFDQVCYRKFLKKVGSCGKYVEAKTLPPTSDVCKYNPLKANFQVQAWKNVECRLDFLEFGWIVRKGEL